MADISAGAWFDNTFMRPIVEQGVAGYNIVNTIIYGLVFALAVFGVYKLLMRLKIKIDRKFLIGITPFIIMGSVFRVVRDAKIYETWVFVSPIIYMFIFVVALASLLVAVGVERIVKRKFERYAVAAVNAKRSIKDLQREVPHIKIMKFLSDYHKLWAVFGIICVIAGLVLLAPLGIKNWAGMGIILGIAAAFSIIIYILYRFRNKSKYYGVFSKENSGILGVHLFDASSTFVALTYFDYYEQHVVSSAAISLVGPIAQFALKIVVVLTVLWALDKYLKGTENDNLRNFLKIAIIILGLAPGLRNFTRLGLGV